MSCVKVNENLYIVEQSVKNDKVVEKRNSVNHVWIYDRSGSMWDLLPDLTKQLISLAKQIAIGDTLTIGWFSGRGEYNFILKGFKISEESDYAVLENAILKNNTTIGLTCFSEILTEAKTVIEDLSVYSKSFSLHFFTDGYPNEDSNAKIFEAINGINGKIDSSMIVGYGYYYNKDLMTKMAEKLGAMLIHSSMVPEYSESITRLMELSGSVSPKQEVLPPVKDPIAVFTITDQGVVVTSVDDETGMVYVSPQGERTSVYYVSTEKPEDEDEIEIGMISMNDDESIKGVYASALVLTQQVKTDVALEIIGGLGDKSIVDSITNAFTIAEFGRVENLIGNALSDASERFVDGRDTEYLPPADALCVYDVLTRLMDDEDACFYPYHKGFKYNKVSKPTVYNDNYAKFVPIENAPCAMDDLVWNSKRLNLSVRATINGSIDLKNMYTYEDEEGNTVYTLEEQEGSVITPASVGVTDNYPVFVYRNYTFVKDGIVNVNQFYVSSSAETKQFFEEQGIVINESTEDMPEFDCDGIYGIDISKLPAINRALAEGNTSATKLCTALKRDMELSGEVKALKDFLNNEFDDSSVFESPLITEQQKVFLETNGVNVDKGGVYSPKTESVESTDVYIAKKFEIKIKSLSSLPTVKKVVEKMEAGKKRTLSESVVEVGITKYEDFKATTDDEDMRKLWLTKQIGAIKAEQKELRNEVQKAKLAIIMGRKWFDEFESLEDNVLEHDGWTFTFVLGEEAVKI